MLIDHSSLSADALRGIVQQYIYSHISEADPDLDVELWTEQVIGKVKSGELLIEFSEHNESVYLKAPEEIVQLPESNE